VSIPEPTPTNDRGFLAYAGGPITTDYGHEVSVYESSAASGPHAWLKISDSPRVDGRNAHLSLAQAITIRAALDQFIEGVPERWDRGAELLDEARREVFGDAAASEAD
jgi:hypothetical protein